jgi:hypothetical protein
MNRTSSMPTSRNLMGPSSREENLEARVRHMERMIADREGKLNAFRAWLKANATGGPMDSNIMADRALAQLHTLIPEASK